MKGGVKDDEPLLLLPDDSAENLDAVNTEGQDRTLVPAESQERRWS